MDGEGCNGKMANGKVEVERERREQEGGRALENGGAGGGRDVIIEELPVALDGQDGVILSA